MSSKTKRKCSHCEREVPEDELLVCPQCEDECCDNRIAGKHVACFNCENAEDE